MRTPCLHLVSLDAAHLKVAANYACPECVALGDTWVHLRVCQACSHVGCCNDSKNRTLPIISVLLSTPSLFRRNPVSGGPGATPTSNSGNTKWPYACLPLMPNVLRWGFPLL
jgi:hypothetical protein